MYTCVCVRVCVSECLLSTLEICLLCANVRKAQRVVAGAKPTLAYLMPPVNTRSACLYAWPGLPSSSSIYFSHETDDESKRVRQKGEGKKTSGSFSLLTSFSGRCITRTINASLGRWKAEKAKYLSGAFRSVRHSLTMSPSQQHPHEFSIKRVFHSHIFHIVNENANGEEEEERKIFLHVLFSIVFFFFLTALLAWKLTTREACPQKVCLVFFCTVFWESFGRRRPATNTRPWQP